MKIVIGSDHSGFRLKEFLKKSLQKSGHDVADFGCYCEEAVDWPDIALLVAESVTRKEYPKGILIDGTGGAMPIAANKVPGVIAVCAYNEITARFASEHDDANILCLGAKMLGDLAAEAAVKAWLETPYAGGRHERRLAKLRDIEKKYSK
ncbi:MAG: ribose-5-phosphate isomerase [Elusimicrobia bacterium HGW-Elusimicrobia-1]|jgi:ribose 5-phosphate isomerase B|nr:MAG: ribose-5-phosphate isomerase [Elusimicrobia bacterium HGW-Elusimicrobia-1]